jgi:hypothetical protein
VAGPEGYYKDGKKRVLLLVGEEVHDQARDPQKSHLLVFGAGKGLSAYANNPQLLVDSVRKEGGYSFIAHPFEHAALHRRNRHRLGGLAGSRLTGIEL